eukprot:TRINITY_DN96185_c0_g1_i1.p2 TRINITY_DN96185_c0_g1~~TRINITY_DN96185_c0_g1_i1.p2  ORF type:complete len:231 (-),score=122.53 TRINITY_DN96185_c0_g1_i1:202-855(-)
MMMSSKHLVFVGAVALLACASVSALSSLEGRRIFKATPMVAQNDEGMRFAHAGDAPDKKEARKYHNKLMHTKAATQVVRDGGKNVVKPGQSNVAATAGDVDDEINKVDLSKIHRECPPTKCKVAHNCPLDGGVPCKGCNVCCPKGSTCLSTNPPTCIVDQLDDPFRCAYDTCAPGFHCPHDGVKSCCLGGNSCCPSGYHCVATQPTPTCAKNHPSFF